VERDLPGALSDHVVICNANAKFPAVARQLRRAAPGLPVVLLAQDRRLWAEHPDWHPETAPEVPVLFGCPTDRTLLRRARLAAARAAVILADPLQGELADARSTLVAVAIERENPQVHTVIELLLSVNRAHLAATEVNEVICLGEMAEKLLAQSCITPGSSRLFAHLLSTADETSQIFLPVVPAELAGRAYRALARQVIATRAPFLSLGYVQHRRDARPRVVLNPCAGQEPGKDTALAAGDRLIVLATAAPDLAALPAPAR